MLVLISEQAVHSSFESSFSRKLLDTDSFSEQHASRFDGSHGQGCIWNGGCILIREKCLAGMISNREFHPDLKETSGRDDFQRRNASLKARIANLRCMRGRKYHPGKSKEQIQDTSTRHTAKTTGKPQQKQSKNQQPQQTAAMSCKHNMAAAYSFHLAFIAESNAILISPLQPAHHNQPCRC